MARAPGYLTVYPTGVTRPVASNLNWAPGITVPNLVEVGLGTGGRVTIYNAVGSTEVVADVSGWVGTEENSTGTDGLLAPLQPARLLDTRSSNGGHLGPVRAGETVNLQVTGRGGVPQDVEAVVLNVTVTNPTAPSYLTVWPAGQDRPVASSLNFVAGQTVPNRVFVEVSNGGQVSIYNPAGSVDVIVDVNGAFTNGTGSTTGGRFVANAPVRIYDSRNGDGPLGPAETRVLNSPYDPTRVMALVLNVTVTDTTAASYLTAWPGQTSRPLASDLNWVPRRTVPNLAVVGLGSDGSLDFDNAAGSTSLALDKVGKYVRSGTATPAVPVPGSWTMHRQS